MESGRSFRSDNAAGICPEALEAIRNANDGSHVTGYGDDHFTEQAVTAFRNIFGREVSVHFVATGTAANTLAIAALTEPWERILCHVFSHLNADESTAPERLTHLRVTPIVTPEGISKLTPEDVLRSVGHVRGDVHEPAPGVLSVSNPTEFGEVYTHDELRMLCDVAHSCGYRVHVDGARFANAVASLNCHPNAIAGEAGVDALSFGGTKNGLALGEAIVFFPQENESAFCRAERSLPFHRKATGHLLSKHRFLTAPFAATLTDGSWLRHAGHANGMACLLARAMREHGLDVPFATDANGVFAVLPTNVDEELRRRGHQYYLFGEAEWNLGRFMCSFDTQEQEIEALRNDLGSILAASGERRD